MVLSFIFCYFFVYLFFYIHFYYLTHVMCFIIKWDIRMCGIYGIIFCMRMISIVSYYFFVRNLCNYYFFVRILCNYYFFVRRRVRVLVLFIIQYICYSTFFYNFYTGWYWILISSDTKKLTQGRKHVRIIQHLQPVQLNYFMPSSFFISRSEPFSVNQPIH